MPATAMISVFCPDRPGLIAAIAGHLFDLGANLGDTGFVVLGTGAEFNSVCELPDDQDFAAVESGLKKLPELAEATVSVRPFRLDPVHGPSGEVTHHITVSGGDQPGLIARLCETLVEFGANVVSLSASAPGGDAGGQYTIRIAAWIPAKAADSCLATLANTAQNLRLRCHWEAA